MVLSKVKWAFVFLFFSHAAAAQVNRYMVFFKDKTGTSHTISNPLEFLSQKAVDRRTKQHIAVTASDLPVNENYVLGVKDAGANVYFRTRWMNGVLVQCNASVVPAIQSLPYVVRVELVAPDARLSTARKKNSLKTRTTLASAATQVQLHMIGLDDMQTSGYKGENMTIAIFDSGFEGVDAAVPFQHNFNEGRINLTASHDFVTNSDDVFQYDDHGTEVFSVIAAYQEGTFTGGAYEANYQLYVTEDASTEYRIEEYNWLFAAERADSAGVDIVNSSLGYYDFDDTNMNYPQSAMDGKTTVVTRAAQALADRGVVVVCSAGNEGGISWQIVTAPADARDVLAVGSVNGSGQRINSSSKGPTADGRIKPDVAALGASTAVIKPNGSLGTSTGTSLSAPLITSLVAGVWQKYPELSNKDVMAIIRRSASLAKAPNNLLGYGIPNFTSVGSYLQHLEENPFEVFPNPIVDTITIKPFSAAYVSTCQVELISSQGQLMLNNAITFSPATPDFSANLSGFSAGVYILRLLWNGKIITHKLVKQ
jgi:serine protease AprX